MVVKPIKPEEAGLKKCQSIPYSIIRAFNEEIVRNLKGNQAYIVQDKIIERAIVLHKEMFNTDLKEQDIIDNAWLDVEPMFREAGWQVEYDKPKHNEDYKPFFIFTNK